MRIKNFNYNGFCGKVLPGFAPYTGEFIEWTADPGIAKAACSDGKIRPIPTYAMEGFKYEDHPKQTYENGKLFFGFASHS